MKSKYAQAKLDFLDSLFHDFENQKLDDYTKSHIAKYLTVLCSGIFEDIFKHFILELAQKDKMGDEIKEFIFKKVRWSLQNAKYSKLISFLEEFNLEWAKKLNAIIEEKNKDALSSIVNNKNLIAHGDSSTITFPLIKQHYENSKIIIYELDKIILS
jgi:hypothetical protein